MLIGKMQKRGSVVVVESSESADIFQLPLNVNSQSHVGRGTKHDWLFSVSLPEDDWNYEGFLRER